MIYKIPAEFVAAHGDTLDGWNWPQPLPLDQVFPQYLFIEGDRLEVIRQSTIAAARAGTMMRMRKAVAGLPSAPTPTTQQIAAVLERRNPS